MKVDKISLLQPGIQITFLSFKKKFYTAFGSTKAYVLSVTLIVSIKFLQDLILAVASHHRHFRHYFQKTA